MSLLGEEKVSLFGSREVGYTISSIEHGGPLAGREIGIWADLKRLVVAKVTIVCISFIASYQLKGPSRAIRTALTSGHGTRFAIHLPR